MKIFFLVAALLSGITGFGQTAEQTSVLKLSETIFQWEVGSQFDSLAYIFEDQFMVVSADGSTQLKNDYINRLRSSDFVHNKIEIKEAAAIVEGNTAVVAGKGTFAVTVKGTSVALQLSYMEVFSRKDATCGWKVLAMKANVLGK